MDEKCKNCESSSACVPFFLHENAMIHKDRDNKRMFHIVIALCVVVVVVVTTLVAYYTSRTQMWNDTISKLNATIIELSHGRTSEVEYAKEADPPGV